MIRTPSRLQKRLPAVHAVFLLLAAVAVLRVQPAACQEAETGSQNGGQDDEEPHMAVSERPLCTEFKPKKCWYKRAAEGGTKVVPDCMDGLTCNFDVQQRLRCPFWASGTYKTTESEAGCSTVFMEEVHRPNPTCATTCCTADPGPGAWVPDLNSAGHSVFQPDSGCTYHQYGRSEILEFYQDSATDILVIGDSFMRQLFVRLLHLMRGQERVVDFKIHTHASYAACDKVDSFLVSPAYTEKLTADKDKQFFGVSNFFHRQNVSIYDKWSGCSQRPMQVHYMFGSTFRQQERNMQQYAKDGFQQGSRVDVIISVMFWTHAWETPQDWLDAISSFKAQPFVRRVFLLGIPTARVSPNKPDYVKAYQNRNLMMRQWAANQTEGAYYIDFDVLSTAPNIPAACDQNNKHYACHLRYKYQHSDSEERPFYEPVYYTPVSGLFSSEDGECYDDVNAAVWQLYFNVAMKGKRLKRRRVAKGVSSGDWYGEAGQLSLLRTLFVRVKHFLDRINKRGVI